MAKQRSDSIKKYKGGDNYWILFLSFFSLLIESFECHPISISPPLISLERTADIPDIIHPSICPSKCKELFRAKPFELGGLTGNKCACICPEDAPIFHTTDGVCVENFAKCPHQIYFTSLNGKQSSAENDQKILSTSPPTFRLPINGGVLNPRNPFFFKDLKSNEAGNCTIRRIFSDTIENSWKSLSSNMFTLITINNNTFIKWTGNDGENRLIEGSAIQIQIECSINGKMQEMCIPFRIAGRMEIKSGTALVTGSTYRSNLTIIIILCILLMLSIVGSVVAWNVCWRMKKERLVHEIQMQFLVHFRQQHDIVETAAMAAMQQQQQSFGGQSSHPSGVLTHSEFSPLSNPQQMQSVPTQKRKLYFSTDFFEPNHMINPPPMAEQFLYDLRKMIDVAKERIRLKRHIPQLPGIVEDIEEDKSTKREAQSHSIYENIQNQQESPRSGKSVDSGNESPEESGELLTTSSDGSDEEKAENGENQEKSKNDALIDGEGQVKRLVSGFEAANSPITTPRILQQSRIPTLSPKTSRANLTLGANAPNERVIPIKQIPAASSPSGLNAYRKTKNKGYAVFPVDPMLKKSLPRRPKREAIQQRNREVEKC